MLLSKQSNAGVVCLENTKDFDDFASLDPKICFSNDKYMQCLGRLNDFEFCHFTLPSLCASKPLVYSPSWYSGVALTNNTNICLCEPSANIWYDPASVFLVF